MLVSATAFQNEVGKYLKIVEKEDVYVQNHGKVVAVISKPAKKEKATLSSYAGILEGKAPKDITMKDIKEERLREKYGYDL